MGLWRCILYLALCGSLSFILGRLLPKKYFHSDRFPFRPFAFEPRLHQRLHIHRWQSKLPDMSRILPGLMPTKNITGLYRVGVERMLQETCVAEYIHALMILAGLYCLRLWPGIGGALTALVNALFFNLPFILIQRYNRPRLLRLREKRKERNSCPP